MSEQQNGFSRMNNVNHSGGTNRPSSGPARSEKSASRRFSNIPLARKIEALILTAVTVIASASVDWSSLTVTAEEGNTLNSSWETVDESDPTIIYQFTASQNNESTPYDAIMAAYVNLQVTGGSADFYVDVYQNYHDADFAANYKSYTNDDCAINNGKGKNDHYVTGTVNSNIFGASRVMSLWNVSDVSQSPVIVKYGENAAIVITFENITAGTTIQYGQGVDEFNETYPIELRRTPVAENSFTDGTTLNGSTAPFVLMTDGSAISYDRFTISPAYERKINYTVSDTNLVDIDTTNKLLSPINGTPGATTLTVSAAGANSLTIPVKVVSRGSVVTSKVYDGQPVAGVAPYCSATLTEGQDYSVLYNGQDKAYTADVGTYTATVTGISGSDYEGLSYTQDFTVTPKSLNDGGDTTKWNSTLVFTPSAVVIDPATPAVYSAVDCLADTQSGQTLVQNKDYTIGAVSRVSGSLTDYQVTFNGKGNYEGSSVTATITGANTTEGYIDLSTMVQDIQIVDQVTSKAAVYVFDGNSHSVALKLLDAGGQELPLVQGTDYDFTIVDITDPTKVIYDSSTGAGGVTNAGTYKVIVTGKQKTDGSGTGYIGSVDSYALSKQVTFTVSPLSLTSKNFVAQIPSDQKLFFYDGVTGDSPHPDHLNAYYPYKDASTSKTVDYGMVEGTDFTVEYEKYSATQSSYSFILTGKGNFQGAVNFGDIHDKSLINPKSDVYFQIIDSLDAATVTLTYEGTSATTSKTADWTREASAADFAPTYTGNPIKPTVSITMGNQTLTQDDGTNSGSADYKVVYTSNNCTKAGQASLVIQGENNYSKQNHAMVVYFTIAPQPLATDALQVNVQEGAKVYAMGKALTLSYASGSSSEYYILNPTDKKTRLTLARATADEIAQGDDYVASQNPNAAYYVTYDNNTEAGSNAEIIAHGINNYSGTSTAKFTISPMEIKVGNGFSVAALPDMTYTGSDITIPDSDIIVKYVQFTSPTVLVKDTDYYVTYKNNRNVTTNASMIVNGKGNFKGTITVPFKIVNQSISDKSIQYIIGRNKTEKDYKFLGPTNNTDVTIEYTGTKANGTTLPVKLRKGTNNELTLGTDYKVIYPDAVSVGQHSLIVSGAGIYAGSSAYISYWVTERDISNVANLRLVAITSSAAIDTATNAVKTGQGILVTGKEIKRYYQVVSGNGTPLPEVDKNGNTNYTYSWQTADGADAGTVPTVAGTGYKVTLTGSGNYTGSKTLDVAYDSTSLTSTQRSLMVGASLDVEDIIKVYGADTSGDPRNVPFLGNNMPAVDISGSGSRTSLADNNLNKYVDGAVALGTLSGPSYTNGFYDNANAADYTVHFVDSTGQTEYPSTTALAPGTVFRVKIEAKDGSTKYFGSHMTRVSFKMAATSLKALKASSKANAQITVEDTANADAGTYVVSGGSAAAPDNKLSYEYTGANITPNLSVVIEPSYTGFNGSFNSIDLASYGKTQTPTSISGSAVTASDKTIKVSANTTYFKDSIDVPYAITAYTLQPGDISIDKLNLTYNGDSHEDAIKGAISVKVKGTELDAKNYDVSFYRNPDGTATTDFTNAGDIYIKVSIKSSYKAISGTNVQADGKFTIAPRDISNVTITFTSAVTTVDGYNAALYKGSAVEPYFDVKDESLSSTALTQGTDYTYSKGTDLKNNNDIGTATVTITGTGNYTGTKTEPFYIYGILADKDVDGRFVTKEITESSTGKAYVLNESGLPELNGDVLDYRAVVFTDSSSKLKETASQYFTISVQKQIGTEITTATDIAGPGTYKITYKGQGVNKGFTGSQTFTVLVQGYLNKASVSGVKETYSYLGSNKYPGPGDKNGITVALPGGYTLQDKEYDIAYNTDQYNVGSAHIVIKPYTSGNYSGLYKNTKTVDFKIRYDLSAAKVTLKDKTKPPVINEDADAIAAKINVNVAGKELEYSTDYQIKDVTWPTRPNNSKASLSFKLEKDAADSRSYNSKTVTNIGGTTKSLDGAQVGFDDNNQSITYDAVDHLSEENAKVSLTVGTETLNPGTDYSLTWFKDSETSSTSTMKDKGTYTLKIKGLGEYYTDTYVEALNKTFTINPKDISSDTLELTADTANAKYYSGAEPNAEYTLTDSLGVLTENTDYTIAMNSADRNTAEANNWKVGTKVKYTAKGIGNFTGEVTSPELEIVEADLSVDGVIKAENVTAEYDGKSHGPDFEVYRDSTKLVKDTDYSVDPDTGKIDAGTYTYTITGKGNYKNSKDITFTITPRPISSTGITVSLEKDEYPYNDGSEVKPKVTVNDPLITAKPDLTQDTDFTVAYTHNTASHAKTGDDAPTATVSGIKNYTGSVALNFQIGSDIADAEVALEDPTSREYSSTTPFRPNVKSITFDGTTYTSTSSPKLSEVATWSYEKDDVAKTPITSSTEPKDAGNYIVKVTGKGPFFGTNETATYTITANEADRQEIKVEIVRDASSGQMKDGDDYYYYYTGKAIEPAVKVTYTPDGSNRSVTLHESTTEDHTDGDYYVTYDDNIDVGTATINVILVNNYSGDTKHQWFEIRGVDISKYKVRAKKSSVAYTGYALEPGYILTTTKGDTYDSEEDATALENLGITAEYTNNIAPGTGNIIVSGSKNSAGTTATATFNISADLSTDVTSITPEKVFRTGSALSPAITLHFTDKYGNDHPVASTSNWLRTTYTPDTGNWATAKNIKVAIKPASAGYDYLEGRYTGTIELTTVPPNLTIDGYQPTYQYTGTKINPTGLTVKSDGEALPSGATVSFSFNSSRDGSACVLPGTVTITATVTYGGESVSTTAGRYSTDTNKKPATFTIVPRPIKACVFQGPSDARYTGSAVSPIFSINTGYAQLRNGTDYTYTVRNNVKPGNAIVTITGRGNYIGTTTKAFHIYVAPVTGLSSTNKSGTTATIRWRRSGTADGYRVTYTSSTGVRKMLITSGTANNYKLTDLRSGSTQVLVEAYVAGASGRPIAYSAPASVYVR